MALVCRLLASEMKELSISWWEHKLQSNSDGNSTTQQSDRKSKYTFFLYSTLFPRRVSFGCVILISLPLYWIFKVHLPEHFKLKILIESCGRRWRDSRVGSAFRGRWLENKSELIASSTFCPKLTHVEDAFHAQLEDHLRTGVWKKPTKNCRY